MAFTGKILCAGLNKTGTSSVEKALRFLGYTRQAPQKPGWVIPSLEDPERVLKMSARFEVFSDIPWNGLWREFLERYPGSRVVLTVREPGSWVRSLRRYYGDWGFKILAVGMFRRDFGVPQHVPVSDVIDDLERALREAAEAREAAILSYCRVKRIPVARLDLAQDPAPWAVLAKLLDVEAPGIAFPKTNRNRGNRMGGFLDRRLVNPAKNAKARLEAAGWLPGISWSVVWMRAINAVKRCRRR